MDERVAVTGLDEVVVTDCSDAYVGIVGAEARGNDDAGTRLRRPLGTEHDVLLQDLVVGKGPISCIEHMDLAKAHGAQEEAAERVEVGSVAEAPRGDRDHLPTGGEDLGRNGEEARIQVACLDPDLPEQPALTGFCANLPVRRVQDGAVESFISPCREEIARQTPRPGLEEIFGNDTRLELDARLIAGCPAEVERCPEIANELGIDLIGGEDDGLRPPGSPGHRGHKGGGEASDPGTGVKYAQDSSSCLEHPGHKHGDGRRRHELSHDDAMPRVQPPGDIAPGLIHGRQQAVRAARVLPLANSHVRQVYRNSFASACSAALPLKSS
jgi:hypothetical protein